MHLFDDFIKSYDKDFLWSNFYLNLDNLERNLNAKKLSLEKMGQNFIFYQQTPRLMWYFANEKLECKKDYCVKILSKNEAFLQKQDDFLKQSGFVQFAEFKEMKKMGQDTKFSLLNAEFADTLKDSNLFAKKLHTFLSRFFSPVFLLFYDEKALRKKFLKNEAFVLLKGDEIAGALVFSVNFNSAMLDFIAVDEGLKDKYTALHLLNAFFKANEKAGFFKLFVEKDNHKAIHFYLKNGFEFSQTRLLFYKEAK